ncbi:MAG: peptidoglycan DD-metalloendopeptidase family protein [Lachnospiraceae bacterium]|nr:peptidoglycan DD-metalloendopeptidase family protein [Lachnospiraceae bacterium]
MKKRFYKVLAVFMSAVVLAGAVSGATVSADTKSDLEDKKEQAEKNQKKLEKALEGLENDKANLEKYVKQIDAQLSVLEQNIDTLNGEIAALAEEIQIKTEELAVAKQNEETQYNNMQKRIQFLYENGNMDYLEAMLSASTMSSILNRSEYVTQISEYDYNMLMALIAIKRQIADAEALLEADKASAEQKKEECEQEQERLEAVQARKQKEIKNTQSTIDDTMEQIEAYEREVAKYDKELEELERQAIENGGGGDYTGGQIGWPCPASHRISSGFGPRNTGIKGASRIHKGIDIPVATGSSAVAAESGTVIAVSYNSARGYYCMVNHGGGLTTLYQHCSRITVSVGQQVAKGEEVAKTGSTGISSGPHLHFEVRVNGTPVNPLDYVKRK